MLKEYLQARKTSKWTSTMESNIFIPISLEKHHLDTKQD
jgi:hypothetical protein